MTSELTTAYEGVADAWAAGASHLYDRLAEAIISRYPSGVAGQRVLDIGAGTGAISRAVARLGGRPSAVDAAADMVAHMRADGIDAVTGDMLSLPFDGGAFDGAVAAFSLSHVDDPVRGLREARRVVRTGGAVMVGLFAAQEANSSKEVVDGVAERYGFVRPPWHDHLKRTLEPMTNTVHALDECARLAGLSDVVIDQRVVQTGIVGAADIVATRIGMAHLAPFAAALDTVRRREFVAAAVAAVARDPQPLCPEVLIMSSRVPV